MARRMYVLPLVLGAIGCARGRNDPVLDADVADSSSMHDAAATTNPDAPSGTCAQAFTGTLASWSFVGEPGNQTMTACATKANGITAGAAQRSLGLTVVSGTNSINSSNWPLTAQADTTKYYTFSITPPAGCTLSLTSMSIDARASGTGPVSGSFATSSDNYVATASISTAAAVVAPLAVMNAPGMVEIRVYGYAATGTGGTLRLQNTLSVDGSLK